MDELLGAAQLAEQAHRYDEASKLYRRALGRPAAREPGARLPVLDRAAASERKARRHDEAFALHYEAIALKGRSGASSRRVSVVRWTGASPTGARTVPSHHLGDSLYGK